MTIWRVEGLAVFLALSHCTQTSSPQSSPAPYSTAGANNANAILGSGTGGGLTSPGPVSPTCLGILDGAPTQAFPSVWQIWQGSSNTSCTGTFVSDSTLITASHCLPCTSGTPVYLDTNQYVAAGTIPANITSHVSSTTYFLANPAACGDTGADASLSTASSDVAIVIFPAQTSSVFSPLSTAKRAAGTPVTLVGFGIKGPNSTSTAKTVGTNTVAALQPQLAPADTYELIGPTAPTGATSGDSLTQIGDSGGPLFDTATNTLIGTTVDGATANIGGSTVGLSVYEDVNGAAAKAIIAQAVAKGATVNYEGAASTSPTTSTAGAAGTTNCSP